MSLSFQILKKHLDGVKSLKDFNTKLITNAKKNVDTYKQTVGDVYEVFAKAYFQLKYGSTFKNVWYYNEIPVNIRKKLNLPDKDKGVDLLLESFDGKFTAVQCKFRSKYETVLFWGGRDHLAHLIGSGTKCDSYAVFSNAYEIDKDVLSKMKEKPHSFDVLNGTLNELGEEFWDNVRELVKTHKPKEVKEFTPYKDQKESIDAVVADFKNGNKRVKMIRFCGTGKSKIAKWIKDVMNLKGLTVLLVPSLSLAKQAKKDWNGNILYVCSDQSVESKEQRNERDEDVIEADILSLGPNVTTDIQEIRNYASKLPQGVIISTYQSCHLLKEALSGIKVSLTIFDEAHRTASKEYSHYSTLLQDGEGFVSDFRLFMTATQRIVSAQVRSRQDKNADLPYLYSMDNASVYGKESHNFNLRMAIDAKRVTPYIPVVTGITDEMILENIIFRKLVKGIKPHSYDMYANVYACIQAIELKKVRHLIVYHKSIKASKEFIDIMHRVRPDIYSEHLDGTMTAEYRQGKIDQYAIEPIGILSNSRCLTEGLDIPSVDCIVFCDPKSSKIDIIQAMGRAMRIDYDGKVAYIVVPIYVTEKNVTEFDIANSNYATLIYLLKALSEIDFKMQDFITNICIQHGRKTKPQGPNNGDSQGVEILAGVVDFMGDEFVKHFFFTEVTEAAKSHWMYFYTLLVEYWREHGDCNVRNNKNKQFKNWLLVQRQFYRKGKLSQQRIDKMNKINFSWALHQDKWNHFYNLLINYKDKNGNMNTSQKTDLGKWVSNQREFYRDDNISIERIDKLNKIGFIWNPYESSWNINYNKLLEYNNKQGNCLVPDCQIGLGMWVSAQRDMFKKNKLNKECINKLNDIGFVWDVLKYNWNENYILLKNYKKQHGNCNVAQNDNLGKWVSAQRVLFKKNKLSKEYVFKLKEIGFVFDKVKNLWWEESYNNLINYKKKNGNCNVSQKESLGKWVNNQKTGYKNKTLSKDRIVKLNKIGFVWSMK